MLIRSVENVDMTLRSGLRTIDPVRNQDDDERILYVAWASATGQQSRQ